MVGDEIASLEELKEFDRTQQSERKTTPSLKGVLAEIAATGLIRYDWKYTQSLVAFYLDQVITDFEAESAVEVGPPRPLPGGETPAMLRQRLKTLLADQFPHEAPFTIQRLAELLLEPQKQYSRLDKLALALEKLLLVTSTVPPSSNPPPPAKLTDLPPVNSNPRTGAPSFTAKAIPNGGAQHSDSIHPGGEGGFGLASSVLAVSSGGQSQRHSQANPELEEALGHLNEAGVAARAHPQEAPQSPPARLSTPPLDVVPDSPDPPGSDTAMADAETAEGKPAPSEPP